MYVIKMTEHSVRVSQLMTLAWDQQVETRNVMETGLNLN